MAIGIILGVLFGLLTIGGIVLLIVGVVNEELWMKLVGGIGGAAFLLLFIFIPFSFHTVQTGEIAVVKHLGEARYSRGAGTYYDFWVTEKYEKYDAKVQQVPITTSAYSSDSQPMDIELYVQYQIQVDKVLDIASNYGGLSMLENRISTISTEKMKSVLSQYKAEEIIKQRATISPKVEEVIKASISDDYYVNISTVVLTNIDFSDAFEQSVEQKMIAEQQKLQADYENERLLAKAENDLKVAEQQAKAKIEAAKGNAESQKLIAQAEAYSAQIKIVELARSMGYEVTETYVKDEEGNPTAEVESYTIEWGDDENALANKQVILNYIQYLEYLSKWDGKLPTVVSDKGVMIEIPSQG